MVNTKTRKTWSQNDNAETYQQAWYVQEEEVDPNFSYYQKLVEQLLENTYSRGFTTEPDFNVSGGSNNLKQIPSCEVEIIGFKMNNPEYFVKKDVNQQLKDVGKSWGIKFKKSIFEPALKSGKKWLKKYLL